jgi:F-type H+-transporting ATPase subunit gamma
MSSQLPVIEKLLPINPPRQATEGQTPVDYIIEPSATALVGVLLPKFINVQIYRGLLETATGEQAARMVAMDNATRNCKEIIDNLTTLFNKARQSAITTELIDIVSGADAVSA